MIVHQIGFEVLLTQYPDCLGTSGTCELADRTGFQCQNSTYILVHIIYESLVVWQICRVSFDGRWCFSVYWKGQGSVACGRAGRKVLRKQECCCLSRGQSDRAKSELFRHYLKW